MPDSLINCFWARRRQSAVGTGRWWKLLPFAISITWDVTLNKCDFTRVTFKKFSKHWFIDSLIPNRQVSGGCVGRGPDVVGMRQRGLVQLKCCRGKGRGVTGKWCAEESITFPVVLKQERWQRGVAYTSHFPQITGGWIVTALSTTALRACS